MEEAERPGGVGGGVVRSVGDMLDVDVVIEFG